jgi:polysaccharide biosynthesis transport protein
MTSQNPPEAGGYPGAAGNDLERALGVLRRRLWLIVLCTVVTAGVAFGLSNLRQKEYSTTASLLFRNSHFAQELFGTLALPSRANANREAATNVQLVDLKVISNRTSRALGGKLTPEEIASMVAVGSKGESELVTVTVTSPHKDQAVLVANTFARQFIKFRTGSNKAIVLHAQRLAEHHFHSLPPAQRQAPRGEALRRTADRLGTLASLQTGDAELVQPAEAPSSPSSPKPRKDALLGAVVGLLFGLALSFLLERLNRRLRDPEEAEEVLGLPILGTIPDSQTIRETSTSHENAELPFFENEAFRTLRASLRYFDVDRDVRTVMMASDHAGVGKSTIAWNLARMAASTGTAIVVEADLRNPSIALQHGLKAGPGLVEVLTRQTPFEEVVQHVPLGGASSNGNGNGHNAATFDVIVAGSIIPPNPAELVESNAMVETLEQLRECYDLVVVDVAPIGVVSDAFPLLQRVDGVIVVARMGQSTRDGIKRLREQLGRLNAHVLGLAANCVRARRGKYGYGYGYYYKQASERQRSESARELTKS